MFKLKGLGRFRVQRFKGVLRFIRVLGCSRASGFKGFRML